MEKLGVVDYIVDDETVQCVIVGEKGRRMNVKASKMYIQMLREMSVEDPQSEEEDETIVVKINEETGMIDEESEEI